VPELPDVTVYIEHLESRIVGRQLTGVRLSSPFLVRTYDPPVTAAVGKRVNHIRRMGKRIVFAFEDDLFWVLHLMIAGRLHWRSPKACIQGKIGLAAFDFAEGTLLLTEAGTKKRASLHILCGSSAVARLDPGGLEVLSSDQPRFRAALLSENHTLKRALTDPRLFSGIGNAYSDEILHAARLSPLKRTSQLSPDEIERLFKATVRTLELWTEHLRTLSGPRFPEKVTAFREGMAVHGRHRLPCPDCGSPVQRIVYAENETNYCAVCQTEGRLLADRSLSRLLHEDWPRSLDELEERFAAGKKP
jgi:formamidopyrimidine-DNA glycosylase